MSNSRRKRIIPLAEGMVIENEQGVVEEGQEVTPEMKAEWFDDAVQAEVKHTEAAAPQTWTDPLDMAALIARRLRGIVVLPVGPESAQGDFVVIPETNHRFPEHISETEAEQNYPVAARIVGADKARVSAMLNGLLQVANEPIALDHVTVFLHAVRGAGKPIIKNQAKNLYSLEINLIFRVRPGKK